MFQEVPDEFQQALASSRRLPRVAAGIARSGRNGRDAT
jgi:hypothetical protein